MYEEKLPEAGGWQPVFSQLPVVRVSVPCFKAMPCTCPHCKEGSSLAFPDFISLLLCRSSLVNASDKWFLLINGSFFIQVPSGLKSALLTAGLTSNRRKAEGGMGPYARYTGMVALALK